MLKLTALKIFDLFRNSLFEINIKHKIDLQTYLNIKRLSYLNY